MNIDFITPMFDASANQLLSDILQEYERKSNQKVNLVLFDWASIWRELVNITIYRKGGDLAEIGSTWLESLISMNGLRPFSARELHEFGGEDDIFRSLWQNQTMGSDQKIWGVPYKADARVIFYWEDMLEKAGLDPNQAFLSPAVFETSMEKLQQHYEFPLVLTTAPSSHNVVYNTASWLRGAGGEFLSEDGKRTAFDRPEALSGLRAHFGLYRFMPNHKFPVSDNDFVEIFAQRKAAVTMGGPWLFNNLKGANLSPEILSKVKVALPPGPAFIGGTLLVMWQHTRNPLAVINLIKMLVNSDVAYRLSGLNGFLPVQKRFWTEEYMAENPNLAVFQQAIMSGKSMPILPLWGIVEDRLNTACASVWQDLASSPKFDAQVLQTSLERNIISLARRLDIMFSQ